METRLHKGVPWSRGHSPCHATSRQDSSACAATWAYENSCMHHTSAGKPGDTTLWRHGDRKVILTPKVIGLGASAPAAIILASAATNAIAVVTTAAVAAATAIAVVITAAVAAAMEIAVVITGAVAAATRTTIAAIAAENAIGAAGSVSCSSSRTFPLNPELLQVSEL